MIFLIAIFIFALIMLLIGAYPAKEFIIGGCCLLGAALAMAHLALPHFV